MGAKSHAGDYGDLEAEKVILGNCLLQESAEPLGDLTEADFWSEQNRRVVRAIRALDEEGIGWNSATVYERVERDDHGVPASYVAALTDGVPQTKNLNRERQRIRECARRCQAIRKAQD